MNIAMIGTGKMGSAMAANLMKAGHRLTVNDLNRQAAANLLAAGARWADTPAQAVRDNEITFTSLPGPREVESVALGDGGILASCHEGAIYADLSTSSPTLARRIHQEGARLGIIVLDAPVSGGVYGAQAATLTVMVGGSPEAFERIKPVLLNIGTQVFHCGPAGNGMVTKLCNNLVSSSIEMILAEALTLGVKAGVDLGILAQVIGSSTGSARRLTEKFPRYLFRGNFEPGFAVALAAKDIRLATELGREYAIPMQMANLVDQLHVEALGRGWGPLDSDAVARLQEEKAGVQLRLPEE